MVDSVFRASKHNMLSIYIEYSNMLCSNFCLYKINAKKVANNYRLKTMAAPYLVTIFGVKVFHLHLPLNSRFIPNFASYIVGPELHKLIGQTAKIPTRGNRTGLSGAYQRTLQMAKLVQAIIKAMTRAKDVEILTVKEERDALNVFTLFDVRHFVHNNGRNREFELRSCRYCTYISIEK